MGRWVRGQLRRQHQQPTPATRVRIRVSTRDRGSDRDRDTGQRLRLWQDQHQAGVRGRPATEDSGKATIHWTIAITVPLEAEKIGLGWRSSPDEANGHWLRLTPQPECVAASGLRVLKPASPQGSRPRL
jgi:hypothetical protein